MAEAGLSMGQQVRDVWVLTADEACGDALSEVGKGLAVCRWTSSIDELVQSLSKGAAVVIDEDFGGANAFALCRKLRSDFSCRVSVLIRGERHVSEPIARFCGAEACWTFPPTREDFQAIVEKPGSPLPIDRMLRTAGSGGEDEIREGVLRDLESVSHGVVLDAITDPETKLFNYDFLIFKLDEEYKRASRFKFPLSCVMLGFDGEASEDVLLELASIFLNESRDTDILGRFDLNSFLFLLPNTGPDGARAMVDRIAQSIEDRSLKDLVGDAIVASSGISYFPHQAIEQREQLYARARQEFLQARQAGGGVRVAD